MINRPPGEDLSPCKRNPYFKSRKKRLSKVFSTPSSYTQTWGQNVKREPLHAATDITKKSKMVPKGYGMEHPWTVKTLGMLENLATTHESRYLTEVALNRWSGGQMGGDFFKNKEDLKADAAAKAC